MPFEDFYAKLKELAPSTESYAMTIAEQLRQEGRQQGRQEGRLEGRQEGLLEGRRAAVLAFLEARGIPVPEPVRVQLEACVDPDELQDWVRRAATVKSADELLG